MEIKEKDVRTDKLVKRGDRVKISGTITMNDEHIYIAYDYGKHILIDPLNGCYIGSSRVEKDKITVKELNEKLLFGEISHINGKPV